MIESLNPDLAAHRSAPGQDAGPAAGHPGGGRGGPIPFTTGLLVGIGESRARPAGRPGGHRRQPPPPRPRPGGHRPELPAQGGHGHAPSPHRARPTSSCGPSPSPGWSSRPTSTCRRRPTSPTTSPPCSTAGIDDWGGVSPVTADHVNPERAWPALDRLRAATEAAGLTLAPRLTVYPEFALDPERWLDRAMRFPVLDASDAEGLGRDHPWCSGGEMLPPALLDPAATAATEPTAGRRPGAAPWPSGSAVGEVLAGVAPGPGGRRGRDRDPVRGPRARGPGGGRAWPTSSGPKRSATRSPSWSTATSTTPTSAPSSAGSAPSPRDPSPSTSGARPTCSSLDEITDRVREAEALGATEVCLQGGIHPKFDGDYYLDVITGGARGVGHHPHPRLHRARGHRRGPALGRAPGRLPGPGCATPGLQDPAGHGGRDPRRRGPGRPVPGQDQHRGVAGRPPDRPRRGAAVQRHHHVRRHRAAPVLGPAPGPDPRTSSARPAGSPSSSPCPSCTWPRPSTSSARPAGARPSARPCSCTPSAASPTAGAIDNIQVSWVKMGRRRRAPDPPGRRQRPRGHADGREHLPGRRGQPRSDDGRRGVPRPWWHRSAARWSSGPPCTAGCGAARRVHRRALAAAR